MKNAFFLVIFIALQLLTYSCTDSDEELLNDIENILPGSWAIDTFNIPAWGSGIRHDGAVIYSDTVLYDVGEITIPVFSTDTLNFTQQTGNHLCTYTYQNDELEFRIESVSVYHRDREEDDYFLYFRNNFIDQSPVAHFVDDSRILSDNFILKVVDVDHISIHDPDENLNRSLYLSRK